MTLKFNSLPRKTLAEPITSSATSFKLNNIKKWDGTDLTSSDFGTVAYGAIRDASATVVEFFAFDPSTIASSSISFTYRGLAYNGENLTTEVSANKLEWGKGSIVEIGTHGPQIFEWLKEYIDGIAIAGSPDASATVKGIVEIATASEITAGTATGGTGAALAVAPDQLSSSSYASSLTALAGETITGATLPVPVYQNKTDNEFYICDANDTSKMKFVGFAISNGTDGNTLLVQFTGIVSGFSALDEGEKYYLSDTAGAISTTPGTNEILVGIAISTTQLLIQKGRRYASGYTTFTSTTTTAITLGFRPSIVRVVGAATQGSSNGSAISVGGWSVKGGNACSRIGGSNEGEAVNGYAWYVNITGFFNHRGTVTTITDTGFTLDNTESDGAVTLGIYWEAEGEL